MRAGFIVAFSGGPMAKRDAPRAFEYQIVHPLHLCQRLSQQDSNE
jgi:hypothetical protein